jgi:hypothetical protein
MNIRTMRGKLRFAVVGSTPAKLITPVIVEV